MRRAPALSIFLSFLLSVGLCAAFTDHPVVGAETSQAPQKWTASWIAPSGVPDAGNTHGVYLFRRSVALPKKPKRFVVHVTADNRYRLYVNGRPVSRGPARGDLSHWRYHT